jgi:hypothetical protein
MPKFTVDNSGQGNCMYYAYGISLMYFLLKKRDKAAAERVFTKLELTDIQKRQLHALLDNKQLTRFTALQLKNILEPILGPATRKISAEKTAEQFLRDPTANPLYTATNYGMVYLFRKELEKQGSALGALLNSNDFDDPDYINAEIYRLFPAEASSELGKFVAAEYKDIITKFNAGWDARVDTVLEYKKKDKVQKTKEQIANDPFYKQQFLEELIGQKTVEFFTANSNQHLTQYENHLNTNYRWGSEESLLLLHRHVTGERQVKIGVSASGHDVWEFRCDTNIKLSLYADGRAKSGVAAVDADMVLNNLGNVHWVSLVEPIVASPVVKKDNVSPIVTVDPVVTDTVVKDPVVKDVVVKDPVVKDPVIKHTVTDTHQTHHVIVEPDPTLVVDSSTNDSRNDLLDFCGFNDYLEQLETKAAELTASHPLAGKEAFDIVDKLNEQKTLFLNPKSKMTTEEFSEACQNKINTSPKDNLKSHRGVGIVFNGLLNAAITVANIFISIGKIFGKFELIDYNRIATKSMENVQSLSTSVNALLAKREREDRKHIEEKPHSVEPSSDAEPPSLA